jgi:hypothetical protein
MNTARFLEDQKLYFADSYDEFISFGGPSVYFRNECLRGRPVPYGRYRILFDA